MSDEKQKILHLHNRAGFGISPIAFVKAGKQGLKHEVNSLMGDACKELPIKVLSESPFAKYEEQMSVGRDRSARLQMIQKEVRASRAKIRDMNVLWMNQLVDPQAVVREKLTLFWHDHFGVRNLVGYYAQEHNNTLRKHALGKFGDLLLAVTKDPAMLQFLNNQQNVKRKPNENFARELLELFTLGRGNYSEQDIKNAARAFTGWGYGRFSGEFRVKNFQHDSGPKEFMGKKGNLTGDDIINALLENRQTARFLAGKLFLYYVSDQEDEEIIDLMGQRLYKTGYDMADLLRYVFESDWFYEDRFMANKIKSPVELINGLRTQLGLTFGRSKALLYLERALGQVLFSPPSVNGWPTGQKWINHTSLMDRMRLPRVLADGTDYMVKPKDDGDANNPLKGDGSRLMQTARIDFEAFNALLDQGKDTEEMIRVLSGFLVGRRLQSETIDAMVEHINRMEGVSSKRLKWQVTTIASLPEYQVN